MESYRSEIILAFVAIYLASCVAIGLWAMRRTRSSSEFFAAGRSLGVVVTAAALFSSTISGFAFVGGPGLVYRMGTSSLWMCMTAFMGATLGTILVAKRIRMIAELRDTYSLPAVLAARFKSESTRFLTALTILVGVIGYLATQILAMATVFKALVDQSGIVEPISLTQAAIVSSAVLVFYCTTGGIIASVYTDLVQGVVMVAAGILVFITAATSFDGGLAGISAAIATDDAEAMGPWGTLGAMGCLSWFLLFALGACGQAHIVTKYMMFKRLGDMRSILPLTVIGSTLAALLWFSIGVFMRAEVVTGGHPPLGSPDQAAADFLQVFAHPLLAGLVFAALLAAIMSTADAFLSIGSAAIVHDIPRALLGRPVKRELFWARVTTVALAAVATVFALSAGDLIALLGAASWGVFASALVPAVAIGLNWKGATPLAVNVSIVFALITNVAVRFVDLKLPHGFAPATLTLIVSTVLFLVVSGLSRKPELERDIDQVLDL
jgi:Na+/proline symporter